MKTLTWSRYFLIGFGLWILLLLGAQVARGQDTTRGNILFPYTDRHGTTYSKPRPYQTPRDLLVWWKDWTDSCWADSTRDSLGCFVFDTPCWFDFMPSPNATDQQMYHLCKRSSHNHFVWRHRDLNDLKGFFEFLMRRIK